MILNRLARNTAFLIALGAIVSLGVQFVATWAEHPDETALQILWRMARFFTILTNLLVAITFGRIAGRGVPAWPEWGGGLTLWIAIVAVVYHVLLAKPLTGLDFWADLGLHSLVPAAAVLWWLIWADRRGLSWRTAVFWLLWPLAYVAYALGRGAFDGTYPYFFTDPGRVGWDGVAVWSATLCVVFFLSGMVVVWLARILPRG